MRIIINCDDLGANATVNDRILELMEQRRVTSATLMMNAPAIEDAVRRIGNYPYCSFGVHLNATEFAPLSAHPGLRTLLNDEGEFAGNARRDPINIPLSAAACEGVYAEWCAQIERARAHQPSGLASSCAYQDEALRCAQTRSKEIWHSQGSAAAQSSRASPYAPQ